jgi:hypothetical protein
VARVRALGGTARCKQAPDATSLGSVGLVVHATEAHSGASERYGACAAVDAVPAWGALCSTAPSQLCQACLTCFCPAIICSVRACSSAASREPTVHYSLSESGMVVAAGDLRQVARRLIAHVVF